MAGPDALQAEQPVSVVHLEIEQRNVRGRPRDEWKQLRLRTRLADDLDVIDPCESAADPRADQRMVIGYENSQSSQAGPLKTKGV
jgi:hypothetical protein